MAVARVIFGRLSVKVSEEWKSKVSKGTSVNWPVGLGGKGQRGCNGPGEADTEFDRIRRVDLRGANNIPYGTVKNSSGNFVKADLASVTAAASGAAKEMPDDFRVSITNAPGKNGVSPFPASPGC